MKHETCKDRIAKAWSRRKYDLERCLYNPSEEYDLCEYGLDYSYVEAEDGNDDYFRYQLSWGGPSDEIRFYEDGRTFYHFMDWFDGARRNVSRSQVMKDLRDWFQEVGSMDFQYQREINNDIW